MRTASHTVHVEKRLSRCRLGGGRERSQAKVLGRKENHAKKMEE